MDDLTQKMTILKLQDEKTLTMKRELELEEHIFELRYVCISMRPLDPYCHESSWL